MSPRREAVFRACFPQVNDPELEEILNDPELVIYSDAEMPKAYQFFDGAFPGVHSVNYNISANGSEPFGNGNREFPWSAPAGTHRCALERILIPLLSASRQRRRSPSPRGLAQIAGERRSVFLDFSRGHGVWRSANDARS